MLGRPSDEIVVRVYGDNPEILQTKAEEVQGVIAAVDGVEDSQVQLTEQEPTIEVEADVARAEKFGISPGDVRRSAATLLSGLVVGNLFEEQKVYDVVVWGAPELRQSESDVRSLLIDTPRGGLVPLGEIADVRVVPNPSVIRHESVQTYVDVTAGVSDRNVGDVANDVEAALTQVDFPLEHHAELLGGFAEEQASRARVIAIAVAALIAMFLMLQALFASWRVATLAFLTLPMALAGGAVAALIGGGEITLGSLAGFVAVFALATRFNVTLVRHYQFLERRKGEKFGADLVTRATRERIAPMVMSALAVSVALAPFVFAGGAGSEIVRPMAIVIIGGLVTTMLMAAVVMPALYLRFGFVAEPDTSADELLVTIPDVDTVRG